ncbi:TVP38/TMEM64 family protein [Candidatus Microgenomates bacterium]|nr:TVP38/TMEM64 family protein [Candidatus Microgenomates bacterium]
MVRKTIRRNLPSIFIVITVLAFLYLLTQVIPEEGMRVFLKSAGIWAPLIFIILSLLTYIAAPVSGTPLLFAGFYVFGANVIILTAIATFTSTITNFWISRIWGRSLVQKFVGAGNMKRVDKVTQNYGVITLFILRLLGGSFHEFISYAAGLTSMRFSAYFFASTVGMIPGMVLWYFLAQKVGTPVAFTFLTLGISAVFLLLFLFVSLTLKRWRN